MSNIDLITFVMEIGVLLLLLYLIFGKRLREHFARHAKLRPVEQDKNRILEKSISIQRTLLKLIELHRRQPEMFIYREDAAFSILLQQAMEWRALPYLTHLEKAELDLITKYELTPFSTLIEHFVKNDQLPSLDMWREDYGYNDRDFVLKISDVEIEMDRLLVELLESMLIIQRTLERENA